VFICVIFLRIRMVVAILYHCTYVLYQFQFLGEIDTMSPQMTVVYERNASQCICIPH
jgi:hypothetical protein